MADVIHEPNMITRQGRAWHLKKNPYRKFLVAKNRIKKGSRNFCLTSERYREIDVNFLVLR